MTSTDMHAALCDAGWRTDMHGKWISPDPQDARFTFTIHAAWREHQRRRGYAIEAAPDLLEHEDRPSWPDDHPAW